jgi:hypothetical protein
MASVDVGDRGGKGIPVLKMSKEDGELHPLHAEVAPVELVVNRGKGIRDTVELAGELGAFVLKVGVLIYLSNCGWVVEVLQFYPHFSTFLTHMTSRALSSHATYPHAPDMCL